MSTNMPDEGVPRSIAMLAMLTIFMLAFPLFAQASPSLKSIWTDTPPQVDGNADDAAWSKAEPLTTHDNVANFDIEVKSVHTDDTIYMLVTFPDATENRKHKLMNWDETKQRYITGPRREDSFVFKWHMLPIKADITLSSDTPYKADIWYWKSSRTDHSGYADDKIQTYQHVKSKGTRLFVSKDGNFFYLSRKGDKGKAAYAPKIYVKKTSDVVPKYTDETPEGSRADIKAKGVWRDGVWTVEFQRALRTGYSDDLQFKTDTSYYFGVSRYEIAGRKPTPETEEPYFGAGEINDLIELQFIKK